MKIALSTAVINSSKRKFIVLIFIVITLILKSSTLHAQGIVSKLIEIKYGTELYLSRDPKKDSNLAVYNTLRWQLDGLLYQLSADMINDNSPRKFNQLNKWFLATANRNQNKFNYSRSIKKYQEAVNQINATYEKYIAKPNDSKDKTINLSTNIFYLLKDSYTIISGLSDIKTKKTMAIIEILDHTRLLSPAEVIKQVK